MPSKALPCIDCKQIQFPYCSRLWTRSLKLFSILWLFSFRRSLHTSMPSVYLMQVTEKYSSPCPYPYLCYKNMTLRRGLSLTVKNNDQYRCKNINHPTQWSPHLDTSILYRIDWTQPVKCNGIFMLISGDSLVHSHSANPSQKKYQDRHIYLSRFLM